ncbi:MAG: riboflavin synthase [Chthonomonas sp.]|nr:riboflavin synthase [Chthonomonas sp.]
MFTGLVQALGTVRSFDGGRLAVDASWPSDYEPLATGESVAVNGCCLTTIVPGDLIFELSPETIARTAAEKLVVRASVNLERALRVGDRMGGHWVQGHVDGVGEIIAVESRGGHFEYRFAVPSGGERYLIDKGSIAIDGISLTVVSPVGQEFSVWVIPHTRAYTNLANAKVGDRVNLEYDLVAKYVERLNA